MIILYLQFKKNKNIKNKEISFESNFAYQIM